MADINTQPVLFTASGLLSAQTGPNGVAFPVNPAVAQEAISPRKWRIQGVKILKVGAGGSAEIYDAAAPSSNAPDLVYQSDVSEVATNLGINIKAGDIYVKITGGYKVWLYLDLNS